MSKKIEIAVIAAILILCTCLFFALRSACSAFNEIQKSDVSIVDDAAKGIGEFIGNVEKAAEGVKGEKPDG